MSGKRRNPGAIDYFDRRIEEFDSIYANKPGIGTLLNKTFRSSMRVRFKLAFEILGDLKGRTVLDIGCGSGRYMFESIKRGAMHATGLDAAAGALDFARRISDDAGLSDRLDFHNMDFLDYYPHRRFDIVFAVGYFDYMFDPLTHLKKMLEVSDGIIYASFPRKWSIFSAIRKIRLALNRCPVRFYTKRKIRKLLKEAGCENYEIRPIFRDNILIIRQNRH